MTNDENPRVCIEVGDKLINVPGDTWKVEYAGSLAVYLGTKPMYVTKHWDRVWRGRTGDIFIKPDGYLVMRAPESAPHTVVQVAEEEVRRIVGEAVGAGSVCWNPRPTGVFDSERASEVVEDTVRKLTGKDAQG